MHCGHVRNRCIGIAGMFATGASASTHAREVVGRRAVCALEEHEDAGADFATGAVAAPAAQAAAVRVLTCAPMVSVASSLPLSAACVLPFDKAWIVVLWR